MVHDKLEFSSIAATQYTDRNYTKTYASDPVGTVNFSNTCALL